MPSSLLALGIWCAFKTWWEKATHTKIRIKIQYESVAMMIDTKLHRNIEACAHSWGRIESWRTNNTSLSRQFKQTNKQQKAKNIFSKGRCKTHDLEVGMGIMFSENVNQLCRWFAVWRTLGRGPKGWVNKIEVEISCLQTRL